MADKKVTKYIERIEIKGLWGRYDVDWTLNSDVNILVGENGTGKSTILQAVKNLFDIMEKIANNINVSNDFVLMPFDKIVVHFREGSENNYFEVNKDINGFGPSISYNPYDENGFSHLPDNPSKFSVNRRSSAADVVNQFNVYHIKTFDKALKNGTDDYKTNLDVELNRLEKEYLAYKLKTFKAAIKDIKALRANDFFNESVNRLFKSSGKSLNEDDEKLSFLLDDKTTLDWLLLSSGEKQLLIILLTVLCQGEKPAILMMDEPELSLHYTWQYELIGIIRTLNPNCQVIIATHSVSIFTKGWMDKFVFIEEAGEKGIRHKIAQTV